MNLYLNTLRTKNLFHFIITKLNQRYFILLSILISIIFGIIDEIIGTGLFFQGTYTLICSIAIIKEIYVTLTSD